MIFKIYNEFNDRFKGFGQVFLAGGCVRDFLMRRDPKDFDVFVINNELFKDFDNQKQLIKAKLADLIKVEPKVEWHKSEPYLVATVEFEGVEVQILFNPAKTIEELLSTFDWNVCLFAYGYTGGTIPQFICGESIENIGAGKDLKLNKLTFPLSTLRRGFRFSERFLMKLQKEDLIQITKAYFDKSQANNDIGPNGNTPDMESLKKNILV